MTVSTSLISRFSERQTKRSWLPPFRVAGPDLDDTDFGELLARSNAALPSVVLFRRVGRTAEDHLALLLLNIDDIAADLDAGVVAVITDTEIRLRRLPIQPASSS